MVAEGGVGAIVAIEVVRVVVASIKPVAVGGHESDEGAVDEVGTWGVDNDGCEEGHGCGDGGGKSGGVKKRRRTLEGMK